MQIGTLTPNGMINARTINQSNLTSECWSVQFFGQGYCQTCYLKGTKDCGGKKIRKTGKNEKGLKTPIN